MSDTTQLEKVRSEMVRRHENDLERAAQRIEELEAKLAAAKLARENAEINGARWYGDLEEARDALAESEIILMESEDVAEGIDTLAKQRDAARAEARVLAYRVANTSNFWDWETKEKDLEIARKYLKDGDA